MATRNPHHRHNIARKARRFGIAADLWAHHYVQMETGPDTRLAALRQLRHLLVVENSAPMWAAIGSIDAISSGLDEAVEFVTSRAECFRVLEEMIRADTESTCDHPVRSTDETGAFTTAPCGAPTGGDGGCPEHLPAPAADPFEGLTEGAR